MSSFSDLSAESELDLLVVGAGFSGTYVLHKARQAGFSVKLFEAGSNFGGVWHWNCYPGARTDSDYNTYQYSLPEIWKDWTWKERFASRDELVEYFEFVDKKLDLRKDVSFNTAVTKATWDEEKRRWVVEADTGVVISPRYLVMCTGYGFKPYYPDIKGLETFKGAITHTSRWPASGIETAGKRIGVIGTGASGVQVIQELAPQAAHLTVFQRTYNTAVRMGQVPLDKTKEDLNKDTLYPIRFRRALQTFTGLDTDLKWEPFSEQTPEKFHLETEELWERGGFRFWVAHYASILSEPDANDAIYRFWRSKVLQRVQDPEKAKLLAPEEAMYPFGSKRPSLEQTYYEALSLPHVDLVDLRANPIAEITEKGVKTEDGTERELDVLILATGFDAMTGGLTSVDIKGTDEETLGEKWHRDGVKTHLAVAANGFPNMFFVYGPQGPTALCIGPVCSVSFRRLPLRDQLIH